MAIQTVYFYPLSTFSDISPDLQSNDEVTGSGKYGKTLTVGSGAHVESFQVNDTDSSPDSLGNHGLFSGPSGQKLVSDATLNGIQFSAGQSLGLGYTIDVRDADGTEFVIGLLKVNGVQVGFVSFGQPLQPEATYTTFDGSNGNWFPNQPYADMAYCFAADALIGTSDGPVPAGRVAVGDRVLTRDHGAQPVRWVGQRHYSAADLARAPDPHPGRGAGGRDAAA